MTKQASRRWMVIGASRGLGHGVAQALIETGAHVIVAARSGDRLRALAAEADGVEIAVGDAADPVFVAHTMAAHDPDGVILVAGAQPVMKPIHRQDWESFSRNWEVDTKATFLWTQAAIEAAMDGRNIRRLVVFSSGAALHGSALSGGYAPAKQAQRFICDYARQECRRLQIDLTVQTILPQLNPGTDLGAASVAAYAARAGESPEGFVRKRFGESPLSPSVAGTAVAELLSEASVDAPEHLLAEYLLAEYLLTGAGLKPVPGSASS